MAFGDCLKQKLSNGEFLDCDKNKKSNNTFWVKLRNVAVEDIKNCYPQKIDSSTAIRIYYTILFENMDFLPDYICEVIPSNKQERFRVANRNLFSSNAFHPDGLANQKGILAVRNDSLNRKGEKIIFQWEGGE